MGSAGLPASTAVATRLVPPAVLRGSARLDPGADGSREAGAWNPGSTSDVRVCPAVRGVSRTPSVHCRSNKAGPSCCSAWIGPARPRTRKHRRKPRACNAGSTTDKWVFPAVCGITWTPASTYAPGRAGPFFCCSAWIGPGSAPSGSTTGAVAKNAGSTTDVGVCPAVRGISRTPSVHCRSNKAGPSCCSAGIGPARPRTRKHRRSQGLQCRIDHGQVGLSCGLWDNLDPSIHLRSGRAGRFSCCSAWIGPARPQVAAPQEPWPKTRDRPRTWGSVLRSVESAGLPASTAVATRLVPPAVLRGSARLGPGPASTAEARACNAGATTDKWVFSAVSGITWTPASTYAAAGPVASPAVLRGSARLGPKWQHHRSRGQKRGIDHGRGSLSCGPWNQQDSQRPLP